MKKILKVIAIFVFFSTCQYSYAQNVIMLKDRVYDSTYIPGFPVPTQGEIYQARIIDGFIYTIEAWDTYYLGNILGYDSWYYSKYDLNGNLIKRKRFPLILNTVRTGFLSQTHFENGSTQIYKTNDNNLLAYIPFINSNQNNILFKFTKDLDSIKLIQINLSNDYVSHSDKIRQSFQCTDGNFVLLTNETLAPNKTISKISKIDADLNIIWTKQLSIDSTYYWLHDPQFFYNGNSFNEINGKYVVGIPKYNQQCIGQNLDPNCGISISNFSIHAYTLEANGILIKQDTFSFNNTYTNDNNFMSYASQIAISDIIPTSNGYRFRLYNYYQNPSQNFSIYITDYNTLTNTASAVNKINYVKDNPYGLLISNPHLKKGFIFSNSSSFNFYNFNSTYSSATLNQNSVKPIPDSFYMYYPNRFQKTIDYRTTWIDENIDTSYLLLGKITLKDSGTFLSIIQLSNSFGVYTGNVYKDNNNNCSFDTITDTPYKYRTVEVTKTDAPLPYKYYDFTDANGKFEIFADTGNFSAKVFPNSDLWSACPSVHNFSLNNANDTVIQNFYLQRLLNCPKLSVSIATDRLRSCIDNSYYINYCNRGTADAVDAYVQVTFDSALIVNSASLPYTHVGNVYSFQVGTIKEDSCGQFIVSTTLNCSTPLGITHCVTAHIYPDSLCATVDPRWDRSNVAVDGKCLGDSVLFRIRNIGTGNMSVPKQYIVIEDNVLRIIPINFQLNAGQELLIKRPANGTTQRLVAEQTDYFPYPSHPTAVVENCGGLNAGFVNQFPNDDAADFIAVNCTQNIGSFDPNDKNGIPEGINTEHLIEKNTDIDYRIRFQNTGTDTAYDVYILDTLSPKLDVATLQMGAASHAYRYEIYGDGHAILKVVFPGINLVDSFKNEPLSHGFFTYRISQDSTNEKGDIIYNAADIYFDSNQPVKTNTTVHTITDVLFSIISTVIENKWQVSVSAYPNPFRDKCTIEINTKNSINGVFHFSLFNLSGQLIEEQYVRDKVEVAANNLSDNIYLYRIEYAGDLVSAGKIIKN